MTHFTLRQGCAASISWRAHRIAFAIGFLVTFPMAAAARSEELPIASAYGTLLSCMLWQNNAERTNGSDYSFIFLTRSSLQGVEWECRFGKVTPTGPSSFDVAASCSGEEDDGATPPVTTMKIAEAADHASVTVTDPIALSGVPGSKLVLPSCKLPYEEQLKLEMERLTKELGR